MELQNISIKFGESQVFTVFENSNIAISTVTNLSSLKTALDSEAGFIVSTAVIQYTDDQYGSGAESRIIVSDGNMCDSFPLVFRDKTVHFKQP